MTKGKRQANVPNDVTISLTGQRVLFVVNVDWFLVSHRLPLVRATVEAGAEVTVACADTGSMDIIRSLGHVKVIPIPLTRSGTGPIGELKSLWAIARTVRTSHPHVVHNVTVKPVMYGTLATRLLSRRARVINAVSGFGFAVEGDANRLLSATVSLAYRLLFRSRRVTMIVQNEGAREWLLAQRCTRIEQIRLIEGSGVDCSNFTPAAHSRSDEAITVVLASRMLRDKGIEEFARAAAIAAPHFPNARFVLAGSTDMGGNPTSYSDEEVRALCASYPVEWLGQVTDMPTLLRNADVFVLPSYHEGLPKALIEAAASGLPLIATDIDGCRPVVHPHVNGELVKPRDVETLAAALCCLLADRNLRERYGAASRALAVERFALSKVLAETLVLYLPSKAGNT